MRVQRFDLASVNPSAKERTPSGGLRVPAAITRMGVFQYEDADGHRWGELRPAKEVFDPASLATLRGAPLTDLHPDRPVSPDTWKQLCVGHLGDDVTQDGEFVHGTVLVEDANEIRRVESGERIELSAGYECDLDEVVGEYHGQSYQRVQKNIRYNHVALGPAGWGRAGSDVALRMDGAAVQVRDRAPGESMDKDKEKSADEDQKKSDADEETKKDMMPADEHQAAMAAYEVKMKAIETALQEALKELAALKSAAADKEKAPVTEDSVPEAVLDAALAKREALRADARIVLGNVDLTKKTVSEIKAMVVQQTLPALRADSLDRAAMDALFAAAVEGARKTHTHRADANARLGNIFAPETRVDAATPPTTLQDRIVALGNAPIHGAQGKAAV